MNNDHFQNQLILLKHHVQDLLESNSANRPTEVESAAKDMLTIINELTQMLPKNQRQEVEQVKEEKRDINFKNYLGEK